MADLLRVLWCPKCEQLKLGDVDNIEDDMRRFLVEHPPKKGHNATTLSYAQGLEIVHERTRQRAEARKAATV